MLVGLSQCEHEFSQCLRCLQFQQSWDRPRWALQGAENVDAQAVFNKEFAVHLKKQAVPCLNLTENLIEYAKQEQARLYYWLDVHWTPLGNRRSAQLVGQYLKRERLGSLSMSLDFQGLPSER